MFSLLKTFSLCCFQNGVRPTPYFESVTLYVCLSGEPSISLEAAMPHPIFFRIGTESRIELGTFVNSVSDFLNILKDVDATVSQSPSGSVRWEVDTLEKRDVAIISVIPSPRKRLFDKSSIVESQVIENTDLLSRKGERNRFLSDRALGRIGKLATRTPRIGPMAIWVPANGRPKQETEITKATLRNVEELTGEKYAGFGSIVGSLESISVHKGNEFRVWDRNTGKPVRCDFSTKPQLEARIKDYFRSEVTVVGMVHMNGRGQALSVDVDALEQVHAKSELVPVHQLSGAIKDFTGGLSLREYLEKSDE